MKFQPSYDNTPLHSIRIVRGMKLSRSCLCTFTLYFGTEVPTFRRNLRLPS